MSESAWALDGYEIERVLGQGGQGTTYLARRLEDDLPVAIKRAVVDPDEARAAAQFERAEAVLAELDHPAIPRHLDSQTRPGPDGLELISVQEYVAGQTVAQAIGEGHRFTEDDVRSFMKTMLEALTYLHEQDPPVLHRDIKPDNIILHEDGALSLVDFGAARTLDLDDRSVIGTVGYMPPEQLLGESGPRSDLYGLAATVLHMVTHRHPCDFPMDGLRLDLGGVWTLSVSLQKLLESMLEPSASNRPQSAKIAAEILSGDRVSNTLGALVAEQLRSNSLLSVRDDDDELVIHVSPQPRSAVESSARVYAGLALGALGALTPTPFWVLSVLVMAMLFCLGYLVSGPVVRRLQWRDRAETTLRLNEDGWEIEARRGDQVHTEAGPWQPGLMLVEAAKPRSKQTGIEQVDLFISTPYGERTALGPHLGEGERRVARRAFSDWSNRLANIRALNEREEGAGSALVTAEEHALAAGEIALVGTSRGTRALTKHMYDFAALTPKAELKLERVLRDDLPALLGELGFVHLGETRRVRSVRFLGRDCAVFASADESTAAWAYQHKIYRGRSGPAVDFYTRFEDGFVVETRGVVDPILPEAPGYLGFASSGSVESDWARHHRLVQWHVDSGRVPHRIDSLEAAIEDARDFHARFEAPASVRRAMVENAAVLGFYAYFLLSIIGQFVSAFI